MTDRQGLDLLEKARFGSATRVLEGRGRPSSLMHVQAFGCSILAYHLEVYYALPPTSDTLHLPGLTLRLSRVLSLTVCMGSGVDNTYLK